MFNGLTRDLWLSHMKATMSLFYLAGYLNFHFLVLNPALILVGITSFIFKDKNQEWQLSGEYHI